MEINFRYIDIFLCWCLLDIIALVLAFLRSDFKIKVVKYLFLNNEWFFSFVVLLVLLIIAPLTIYFSLKNIYKQIKQ